jgi:hypothetical protein
MRYEENRHCPRHGLTPHEVVRGSRGSSHVAPPECATCIACQWEEFEERAARSRAAAAERTT